MNNFEKLALAALFLAAGYYGTKWAVEVFIKYAPTLGWIN